MDGQGTDAARERGPRDGSATEGEPPGRAARGPDEGPAPDGGSGLEVDDEAAVEEIGGGD